MIIWLSIIAIILLAIELFHLIVNWKKWIYINNSKNHSIEHSTYITTSMILLICIILLDMNKILSLIFIFHLIIISFHLKSERIESLKTKK